jgi:hypothetical protein
MGDLSHVHVIESRPNGHQPFLLVFFLGQVILDRPTSHLPVVSRFRALDALDRLPHEKQIQHRRSMRPRPAW